jgi:hypothetical protein
MSTTDHERVAAALPAYEVGGELGRGGWGVVIEGRHRQLDREVAIKALPPAIGGDASVRVRFVTEARLLASLDHPHIVPVFDYVEDEDQCLLVMEKLTGGTVWSRFTTSGLIIEEACAVVLATCSSLQFAHQRGILHRDVKPENLLFSRTGTLKLTDFGIAKVVGGDEVLATRAGEVMGTPAYMAPEQATGSELGPPTDVYAAGVMLYELLSGHLPFSDDGGALATIYRHVYEQPIPLRDVAPQVPGPLADIVSRALATDPDDRWPSAEAFGVALAGAATAIWGSGWPSRTTSVAVMGSHAILAATERPSARATADGATRRAARATVATAEDRPLGPAKATVSTAGSPASPTSGSPPPPAGPLGGAPSPLPAPVRPYMGARSHAHRTYSPDADIVAVRKIVPRPKPPIAQVAAAIALAVAGLAVAFLGLGPAPTGGSLAPGALTVAGTDPSAAGPVHVDLSQPVPVSGVLPPAANGARTLHLGFFEAGVQIESSTTSFTPGAAGRFTTSIDASMGRYLVPTGAVAKVTLLDNGTAVGDRSFTVATPQQPFLTAPAGVGVLVALFSLAYWGSSLRLLRRGRRRLTAVPALVGCGALLGAAVAILAGVATGRFLSVEDLVVCGLLGACSAVASALVALRVAKRRRVTRRRAPARAAAADRAAA